MAPKQTFPIFSGLGASPDYARFQAAENARMGEIVLYNIAHFVSHLRKSKIELVLDVGASIGQFAKEMFAGGYKGKIISFEPLSQAHGQLLAAARGNSGWEVAPRCALQEFPHLTLASRPFPPKASQSSAKCFL
jgi:hypothetical protein